MLHGLKTNKYHITCISKENKSMMLQSFAEKQKYHVTVRVGLRNLAAVFETSCEVFSGQ